MFWGRSNQVYVGSVMLLMFLIALAIAFASPNPEPDSWGGLHAAFVELTYYLTNSGFWTPAFAIPFTARFLVASQEYDGTPRGFWRNGLRGIFGRHAVYVQPPLPTEAHSKACAARKAAMRAQEEKDE